MWFKFPVGVTAISVQQQQFVAEHTDEDGGLYFRAPDHFAPLILALKDFGIASQPKGAPPDLDPNDRVKSDAISQLGGTVTQLQRELADSQAGLIAVNRDLQTKTAELAQANGIVNQLTARIKELEEELEERPPAVAAKK